jgi:hypothetical protein
MGISYAERGLKLAPGGGKPAILVMDRSIRLRNRDVFARQKQPRTRKIVALRHHFPQRPTKSWRFPSAVLQCA